MRTFARLIASAVLLLIPAVAMAGEVQWEKAAWDDIIARSGAEDKYVFVDFYATWCGPCKKLDKVTYQDAKVIEFLNSTIAVKYDAEKGVGKELADEYRVGSYPTLVVIGPDGKEVDRWAGYLDPEEFLATIEGYTKGVGTLASYEEKLAQNPDDLELMVEVGIKYAERGFADKAEAVLARSIEMDPEDSLGRRADFIYEIGSACYNTDQFKEAIPWFQRLVDEYPGTEYEDAGMRRLAYAQHGAGDSEAAVATYRKLLARTPEDPKAMNGFAWFCASRAIGLDEALPVALKAVELSNRSPGILDTLAELYYARGEYDKAIEIGKEALATDPDDQYFQDQVEKFKKAKEEADSQAMR